MKNVLVRSISGAIYVAIMVGAFLAGGAWLAVLLSVLTALGLYEFTSINSNGKIPRFALLLDIAAGVMLVLAIHSFYNAEFIHFQTLILLVIGMVILRMVSQLYSKYDDPVKALSRSFMGLVYVAVPLALVPIIYNHSDNAPHLLLAILIFIWLNDTGAFCTGSLIGRHKLFQRISPNKTWEGFFGGMAFCIIGALLMTGVWPAFFAGAPTGEMCVLAVLVSIAATYGDLIESMIKRAVGVKDTSHLIPGHGGILDRIDSLLLVIPVALIFFIICL